jgi:hypothetical protein
MLRRSQMSGLPSNKEPARDLRVVKVHGGGVERKMVKSNTNPLAALLIIILKREVISWSAVCHLPSEDDNSKDC